MKAGGALIALLLAVPFAAHGQFDLFGAADLALTISPRAPRAGESVTIRAESSAINLNAADISWSVDGAALTSGAGQKEIRIQAGALGSATEVTVDASDGVSSATASITVRPAEVDLLWESDSYTPLLFSGRALPSAGSSLRLEARARLLENGALVPARDIVYTWRKNGSVMASISGRGRSGATIPAPTLFATDVISVEAQSISGRLLAEESARIPSIEPILTLYTVHPLFGVEYHRALGAQSFINETEVSLSAVPFFAAVRHPDESTLQYEWSVNNVAIESDSARPSSITLNSEGSSGTALIGLTLTSVTNLFLEALGQWQVILSGDREPSAENPFGTPL